MESTSLLTADLQKISQISAIPTILEVICRTTGMGFAAIARVTEEKWIACAVRDEILFGLEPGGELQLETTICNEIRQSREAVVIDHVANDDVYYCHATPAMYGFQSYISVPIILNDGQFFGTLCAIDPSPAKLDTPEVRGMFALFADLIAFHLGTIENLEKAESSLVEERKIAELREQFIAILGHDLRSPLGAILNSAQLILRSDDLNRTKELARIIQSSSYRMKELSENLLDFTRGRLGDGLTLNKNSEFTDSLLYQVISETRAAWPETIIQSQIELSRPITCDSRRIAQLFANLLSNAMTHGDTKHPVKVTAKHVNSFFELSVSNSGNKIPEEIKKRLFQPFARGEVQANQQGLGLGLFIVAEIAKAHGGHVKVSSTDEETRFTLYLPC